MRIIKEELLMEMARIGYIRDREIYVFTDAPGNVPHFHIRDCATHGKQFHTCIKIESNEYFHHGDKQDVLNAKDRKELVNFLTSIDADFNLSYWEVLLREWNRNNSNAKVSLNQKMPDYLQLK